MPKRFLFKKWDSSNEPATCWYCDGKTLFFISDGKTGEEFFCCSSCALKKHRIKRLKVLMKNYSTSPKKAILEQKSLIKNSENNASVPIQQTLKLKEARE